MSGGIPLGKITVAGIVLVALFVIAGVVLDVTGHTDQGAQAMATATGIVIGTVGTTVVVQQASTSSPSTDQEADPPKAA